MKVEDAVSRSKQEKSKKLLFDALKNKTSYYLNKPALEDTDLYYYVKDFFREYLDLNKEISFGEIKNEIDKIYIQKDVKDAIKTYLQKISEIEYKDSAFDEDKIKQLIQEFYEITKHMHFEDKQETKPIIKFLTKIGLYKKPRSTLQTNIQEEPKKEEQINTQNETNNNQIPREDLQPIQNTQEQPKNNELPQEELQPIKNIQEQDNTTRTQQTQNEIQPQQNNQEQLNTMTDTETENQNMQRPTNNDEPPSFDEEEDIKQQEQIKEQEQIQEKLKKVPMSNDFTEEVKDLREEKEESPWANTDPTTNIKNTQTNSFAKEIDLRDTNEENDWANTDPTEQTKNKTNKKSNTTTNEDIKNKTTKQPTIQELINRANKTTKRDELVKLYKDINKLYEKETVENRAKIYPDLMKLYKKIAKN